MHTELKSRAASALNICSADFQPWLWSERAPKFVTESGPCGSDGGAWKVWRSLLRKRPPAIDLREATVRAGFFWGLREFVPRQDDSALRRFARELATGKLRSRKGSPASLLERQQWNSPLAQTLAGLLMAQGLPRLSKEVNAAEWWSILEQLIALSGAPIACGEPSARAGQEPGANGAMLGNGAPKDHDSAKVAGSANEPTSNKTRATPRPTDLHPVDSYPAESCPLESWLGGLLRGELALTVSELFSAVENCRRLGDLGKSNVQQALSGSPAGSNATIREQLRAFPIWAGSLARSLAIDPDLGKEFQPPFREQLVKWIQFARPDGSWMFSPLQDAKSKLQDPWSLLERHGIDRLLAKKERKKLKATLAKENTSSVAGGPGSEQPCGNSPHVRDHAVVLRGGGKKETCCWGFDHAAPPAMTELLAGRSTWLLGPWKTQLTINGRLESMSVGWKLDAFCETDLATSAQWSAQWMDGTHVERMLVLPRKGRLAFAADLVRCSTAAQLTYRWSMPLAAGVTSAQSAETWEVQLTSRSASATLIPLGFPEWKSATAKGGRFSATGELEYSLESMGRKTLYVPLFVDLDSRRTNKDLTWRNLTIGADRKAVGPHVALGYRVQIGKEQWLIYRSLTAPANRTILGHNLVSNFLFARFDAEGSVTPLVELR